MNQSPGPGLEAKVIPACHNHNKQTNKLVGAIKDFSKDGDDQNTSEDIPKVSIDSFENPSDIVPKYFCVLLARILFLLMFL